jgi:hypothetical protein
MTRISTSTQRRLQRLRRRQQRVIRYGTAPQSSLPFRFDASFCIYGIGAHHETITLNTGISPSSTHLKSESRRFGGKRLKDDLWLLQSPLGEGASLEEHLDWLWATVGPYKAYFKDLIATASSASITLGCLSESPYPFFSVGEGSMKIVRELELGCSFNFTCV